MKYLTFFAVLLAGLAVDMPVYSQGNQVGLQSLFSVNKEKNLGSVNIRKGRNEIQVKIIDKSPDTGDAMFGLNFIQFENLS